MKKTLLTILCTIIACSCVMGGTLALLADKTETVKNTFTIGRISIRLEETLGVEESAVARTFRMIPGATIPKNPTVYVDANSEDCWLFVKIDESTNLTNFLEYTVHSDWTALTGVKGVYYIEVTNVSSEGLSYPVLAGNVVTVKSTVTNAMAEALTAATFPTLSFTAYAVQRTTNGTAAFTPADAWAQANNAANYPTT